jgi:hypothetical protein
MTPTPDRYRFGLGRDPDEATDAGTTPTISIASGDVVEDDPDGFDVATLAVVILENMVRWIEEDGDLPDVVALAVAREIIARHSPPGEVIEVDGRPLLVLSLALEGPVDDTEGSPW